MTPILPSARFIVLFVLAAMTAAPSLVAAEPGRILGLPFLRFYSFEDIGNASRGARLGVDSLGRLTITHQGSHVVLNDNTWIDLADKSGSGPKIQQVVFDTARRGYYGAFGSWGVLDYTAEGLLRPRPLLPTSYPKWVMASHFTELVLTPRG